MNIKEFREKMQIGTGVFDDTQIQTIIDKGNSTTDYYLTTIKDCVILYEANRKIGDIENMNYYKKKLLGKLGLVR